MLKEREREQMKRKKKKEISKEISLIDILFFLFLY